MACEAKKHAKLCSFSDMIFAGQMEGGDVLQKRKKKKKPPSRKQRRKPSSMHEQGYRWRQKNVRLETHLWHAKRMKMVDKYGFRLGEHCSGKGVRATQRALLHGCLMTVSSVYCR